MGNEKEVQTEALSERESRTPSLSCSTWVWAWPRGGNGDAGSVAPGDAAARGGHEPQGAAPLGDVQRQRKKSVKDFAATKKRILLKKVFKNI